MPDLNETIADYEICNRAEGKSPKTIAWYTDLLTAYARYMEETHGITDLSCIDLEHAREYILYLRGRQKYQGHSHIPTQEATVSVGTVQCYVRTLKAFASWLFANSYTDSNRLQALKLPKGPKVIIEPLSSAEIDVVLQVIPATTLIGKRNFVMVNLMLDTGLRANEVATMTMARLKLADGYLKPLGKGNRERIVAVGQYVESLLLDYINVTRPQLLQGESDALFLTETGVPITVNTLKLICTRLKQKSGVKRFHAHLCRHTFACQYLLNGGDIDSLKDILGHSSLEMVLHYLHFSQSQIRARHREFSPMDRHTGTNLTS